MKCRVIVVGKPALRYTKIGSEEYLKRLKRYGDYQLNIVKNGTKKNVSDSLFSKSEGSVRVVLDERGELLTTADLLETFEKWQMRGIKQVSYLIGGSEGHTEDLRNSADLVLALSPLTMQHELALVVLLEQLYRLATIQRNEPYHR